VNTSNEHLTSETLQAFLEGELTQEDRAPVETHLASCSRCASELEAWELLFSELDELPGLEPSVDFADRVMAEIPARPSLARRMADRVRSTLGHGVDQAEEHLGPDRIQELLEGALGTRDRRRAHAHLHACEDCQTVYREWEGVFQSLNALPRLEPSPEFQERVMAAFQTSRAPARTDSGLERVMGWLTAAGNAAERLIPTTRKGWSFLGAMASVPALLIVAVVGAVLAHPLLSWGGLATLLRWRVAEGVETLMGQAVQRLVDSPLLLSIWDGVSALAATPTLALAGLGAAWTLSFLAMWVLYRNVFHPSSLAGRHV
jgi:anti-sigma factor RsiW